MTDLPAGVTPQDVERAACGIAVHGFGRSWDDFNEIDAHDTDQSDLMEYAVAAITAFVAGRVVVPREPTRAMTLAGCTSLPACEHVFGLAGGMAANVYRAMIAAATADLTPPHSLRRTP
jgi:hypothetical protein